MENINKVTPSKELKTKWQQRWEFLEALFLKNSIEINNALGVSKQTYKRIKRNGDKIHFFYSHQLIRYMKNVSAHDLRNINAELNDKITIEQKTKKMQVLAKFLQEKHNLTFARAISISDQKATNLLSGKNLPSRYITKKITNYFFFDPKYFKNDNENLPDSESLKIDENIASIQRDDFANQVLHYKNKHYISRNYQMLGHKKRIALVLQLACIIVPLLAYTGYCAYVVTNDRIETLTKYQDNGLSSSQQAIQDALPQKEDANKPNYDENQYYANIDIGTQLEKIGGISASSSSYVVKMRLWMDFDQVEYHKMFAVKYRKTISIPTTDTDLYQDNFAYYPETNSFIEAADDVPDWIQCIDYKASIADVQVSPLYVSELASYPEETSSNSYPDKETMFTMGNGTFNADSFSYEKNVSYSLKDNTTGKTSFRRFQKAYFEATINKAFDNPRYPLDSVQFHIYILPMQLTTEYVRYNPVTSVNLTKSYWASQNIDCSLDENSYETGTAPFFGIGNGYRLVNESSGIKNMITRLSYYRDSESQELYRTEYEVLLRANRQGFSLFLQAFVNLFSVVIWISIAFYSQSHQGENQLGMLGTGLFAAISSILVGLSMISDAGIISIITMVNIFTLAVILIMTYHCIASRSAQVKNDKVAMAFNGIKMRVLFYLLIACTAIMFIAIPCISYIWTI